MCIKKAKHTKPNKINLKRTNKIVNDFKQNDQQNQAQEETGHKLGDIILKINSNCALCPG